MQSKTIKWHITIIIHWHDGGKASKREREGRLNIIKLINGFENKAIGKENFIYTSHGMERSVFILVTSYIHASRLWAHIYNESINPIIFTIKWLQKSCYFYKCWHHNAKEKKIQKREKNPLMPNTQNNNTHLPIINLRINYNSDKKTPEEL